MLLILECLDNGIRLSVVEIICIQQSANFSINFGPGLICLGYLGKYESIASVIVFHFTFD